MCSTALLGEETEHLLGEVSGWPGKAEKCVDVGGLIGSQTGNSTEADIERESGRSTDCGDATDNVGAVNRAAVPGVSGGVSSFDKHGVSSSVVGSDGDGFIQKPVKMFDADCFGIAFGGTMESNAEEQANVLEESFECAAIVDNDDATESGFEQHILDKKAG